MTAGKNLVVDPDVGDRLQHLDRTLSSGGFATADDLAFIARVTCLVNDASHGSTDENPAQQVKRLLNAWISGSRNTASALSEAAAAEAQGDIANAHQILRGARDSIGMPFYAEVLDRERERLERMLPKK